MCLFVSLSTQSGRDKQKGYCNRLPSFSLVVTQRGLAAKSVSELNNSITNVRNTHTPLLKPGLFRGEEFIDLKLLPLGPSPLIAGKKEGSAMTVAQWDASVKMSARTPLLISVGFYSECGSSYHPISCFYNRAHLWTKCVTL